MMRAMSFGERSSRPSTGTLPVSVHDRSSSRAAAVAAMSRVAAAGQAGGDSGLEAVRVLKRRLSGVVYAALRADLTAKQQPEPTSDSAAAA